jgi:hypothetical protein
MKKETLMAKQTFTREGFNTARRVRETLLDVKPSATLRTADMLGQLIEQLQNAGVLTAEQIDDMLVKVV